jgi:NAD(P)-dependent dehydrogenase (short-subunit alcohol dehydrogenase family)
VDSYTGKLAMVTGGGSGMGRELVRQLAAQECSVAACDLNADAIAVTAATAWAAAPPGVRVTGHSCDVSDEAQVLRSRATKASWSTPAASTASGQHWARACRRLPTARPSSR